MIPRLSRSLGQQALARIAGVFIIIGVISALLLWLGWHSANDILQKAHTRESRISLQDKLNHLQHQWQASAKQLAATLAFNRLLENPRDRWLRLRAYLSSLGETYEFHTLQIVDKHGETVYLTGEKSNVELSLLAASAPLAWHFNSEDGMAHQVLAVPIWLGPKDGKGKLLLSRELDNSTLSTLAGPNTRLHLLRNGRIVASSMGNSWFGLPSPCQDERRDTESYCWLEKLPGTDLSLHVEEKIPQAIQAAQFSLVGIGLFGLLSIALYFPLGRWIKRTVHRLEHLSQAATLFDERHRLDQEIEAAMDEAAGPHDEVGKLQLSLRELMYSSEEREAENRAYLSTLEILEEAVIEIDPHGRITRASPAMRILAGPVEIGDDLYAMFIDEDRDILVSLLNKLLHGDASNITARLRLKHPEHPGSWVECRFVAIDQPSTHLRGVLRDITQSYLQEKHIAHMALHDALTGLPNRVLLEDRVSVALRMAGRDNLQVGIGFIDLDHFKNVNDALGHKVGDQLLVRFADKLREQLRKGDTLARWGGDEFVVLLPEMSDAQSIREVADKLVKASRSPITLDDQTLPVTFSMGFSIYPTDGENVDQLLSQADQAMFYAKAQGRNTVSFFADVKTRSPDKEGLYIQSRLAIALEEKRLTTWFQPIVDAVTQQPIGLEALARWHDAEFGWVPPSTFIPMLENLGLIHELGDLVIDQTLALGTRLKAAGRHLLLAVNVSKRQLYMHNFIEKLLGSARRAGIEPEQLVLEITESIALGEVTFAQERLEALHKAGFRIAIDDFGVGYSSLSLLHEMPVDELKIDISFTRRVHEDQGARVIQAIVGMSQALKLRIVAEGVEDAASARVLADMGVHCLQGFHFARPMPAEDLAEWLRRYPVP